MLARAALLLLLVPVACSRAPDGRPRSTDPGAAPGEAIPAGVPTFAREAFAPPPGDAGVGELPVPATADPAALAELLAAAPRRLPAGHEGRDGGRIGSDTGVPSDGGAAVSGSPPDPVRGSKIHVGKVTVEPGMSSPTTERAARAQLYWPLVQRCRDPEGAILPPEVVRLAFHLDRDGYVIPATILAVPREPRFADAARCMARELGMATFRAPAAARGLLQNVSMDVPSVD